MKRWMLLGSVCWSLLWSAAFCRAAGELPFEGVWEWRFDQQDSASQSGNVKQWWFRSGHYSLNVYPAIHSRGHYYVRHTGEEQWVLELYDGMTARTKPQHLQVRHDAHRQELVLQLLPTGAVEGPFKRSQRTLRKTPFSDREKGDPGAEH